MSENKDKPKVPNLFYHDLMEEFLNRPEPGEAWYEFVREAVVKELLQDTPKSES
jgi:hypothetical protein